jgi:hypothetical protein
VSAPCGGCALRRYCREGRHRVTQPGRPTAPYLLVVYDSLARERLTDDGADLADLVQLP